ncbi:uncharacterized protein LOC141657025 [Silene latifolia]|uniref:uncharacterized protein LOC141657025 n=1 Tax=Silene latifolia TaxID=37657 RepID=UPI003D77133A
MPHEKGSVGFFSTYRPPQPLDIFSLSTMPSSADREVHLTDGKSYNYNGQVIPPAALKLMLKRPVLASVGTEADVDSGRLTGLMLVSERSNGLETLHIALRLGVQKPSFYSFAEVYGTYNGIRMEDSGVFAGEYLVYVTTKDPALARRQPWTAIYKTHLATAETKRLTPSNTADLNPAISPDGKKIAVASFQGKDGGWQGEIGNLMTNIVVFPINNPLQRTIIVYNGGWPSWGSDNVIFFHRKLNDPTEPTADYWAVFRADLRTPGTVYQVTPNKIKAITPAAIDENTVVIGTIRKSSTFADKRTDPDQYRHVEIYDSTKPTGQTPVLITKGNKPKSDHFNPFVIPQNNGYKRVGYHRGVIKLKNPAVVESQQLMNIGSPVNGLGLFRVSGVFPTFSKDGTKLAFVDNEFLAVWVTDTKGPLRKVYEGEGPDSVFSPIWSQDPKKDILYFCKGPSFHASNEVDIMAIFDASTFKPSKPFPIVKNRSNNAFPCSSPDGTRLVYRSTRDGGKDLHKNLYIREEAHKAKDEKEIKLTRLTNGLWTDTHCDWSPNGKWIVFSSTRDKPQGTPSDNGLDPGYFAVYLLAVDNPSVVVRVVQSGPRCVGHVNHPFFSPKGNSIVIASDLAAVSCDPVSLPLFNHSVRPYGDVFTVDIDPYNIQNNKDIQTFTRMTHSKFENSTCTWTVYSTDSPGGAWNLVLNRPHILKCPYAYPDGSEGWQMTGHLIIPNRRC